MYSIEFTNRAKKSLKKMDKYTQKLIMAWINKNLVGIEDPRNIGKALKGDKNGLWRYRVGDYRIICIIEDEKLIITTLNIGHRREIYNI